MKIPATPMGRIALVCMLCGQLVILVAIALWSPLFRGLEWNTRVLVGSVAIGGAVLYFSGRALQLLARRAANRAAAAGASQEDKN